MLAAGLLILILLVISGCGAITQADRDLAHELMAQSGSNCVHIQGSGGAGGMMPGVPMMGGYGQGSLSAAHSEDGKAVQCDATGAKTTNP